MAGNGVWWWVTVLGWGGGFCRIPRTSLFCLSLPSHHLKDAVELAGLKTTTGTAVDAGRSSALSSPIGIVRMREKSSFVLSLADAGSRALGGVQDVPTPSACTPESGAAWSPSQGVSAGRAAVFGASGTL